ncbi:DUF1028 domain-containing protein [Haloarchaeobius sp. HME9146]|uniref:DUF1028 domain-containing protein n=1 Tax=Haloarchaeobius sp. HME9146 TaxID=2978732 RepID=UPI0021BF626E|nr:DUF1028 domain-containing protein [Haloarchaeobius sp. HME9146]MCT9095362.1 DUF1028 domain-containing protein [Haloarchaeobius sp. HME9146]
MTFSICVRETYEDDDGDEQTRFGVAVTTRLPGVGALCPWVSENGAVSTQSLTNVRLGRKGIEYLDDGLAVADALQGLLNADDNAPARQLHGVGHEGEFAFTGDECMDWAGDRVGENYTVAGNLLAGEGVVDAVAEEYEAGDRDEPLAKRLVDALEAGQAAGGDKREDLTIQSAALRVATTEERDPEPYYDDLRVDATETPISDLRETYELAREGFEAALEKYGDAYEDDDMDAVSDA